MTEIGKTHIIGQSIRLVPFRESHLNSPDYIKWLRDYEVIKYLNKPEYLKPISYQKVKSYVDKIQRSNHDFLFAVEHLCDNKFIGTFRICKINIHGKTADFGILICREHWGKGIAREVYLTALNFCFRKMQLRKVTSGCTGPNIAMRKLLTRVGFRQESLLRGQDLVEGEYVDHYTFGIFNHEFYKGEGIRDHNE